MSTVDVQPMGDWSDYAEPVNEKLFQDTVIALARRYGLLVYHTHDSRRSQPGFPDLTLVGPGGIAFRELKTTKGKPTMIQMQWLETIALAGGDAGIWRPQQLRDGTIRETLARLRKPRSQPQDAR